MASKKAGGTAKNLRDSNPKYLGVKLYAGEKTKLGSILVRQRGTKFIAGKGVAMGKDHTLYAIKVGTVAFKNTRKTGYDGQRVVRKTVDVL